MGKTKVATSVIAPLSNSAVAAQQRRDLHGQQLFETPRNRLWREDLKVSKNKENFKKSCLTFPVLPQNLSSLQGNNPFFDQFDFR